MQIDIPAASERWFFGRLDALQAWFRELTLGQQIITLAVSAAVLYVIVMTRCPGCWIGHRALRLNRTTGGGFTGCSRFPRCRYTS